VDNAARAFFAPNPDESFMNSLLFSRPFLAGLLAAGLACSVAQAQAADPAPPQGVVNLSASASIEVTKDLLTVTMTTTREGQDAAAVQSQLKQALDAALAEAKKVAKPGQLDVQTGNFALYPRYAPKGGINGWQGSAELVVEGRDMQAIGQLTGRITTLTIGRVSYGLSRALREKVEADASAQAIASYRAKAADYAKQFGYAAYGLREVNVSSGDAVVFVSAPTMQAKTMSASAGESLPVEAGKGAVTVTVSGSVQMK
jgi:predicted secreted protein